MIRPSCRRALRALLIALPALPLLAQAPPQKAQDGPGSIQPLDRALMAIQPSIARSDLFFLADDAMGGRDTPSLGQAIAGQYLAARVQALGFTPAGREGWFYPYPLVRRAIDAGASQLEAQGPGGADSFPFGEGIYPERSRHLVSWEAQGPVTFIGDGDKDTIAAADLKGRWAWYLDGGRSIRRVASRVEDAGGLGMLVSAAKDYSKDPYPERFGRMTRSFLRGWVVQSDFDDEGRAIPPDDSEMSSDMLPVVALDEERAERLRQLAGIEAWPEAGAALDLSVHDVRRRAPSLVSVRNVCALLPGTDETLSKEVIVVSAHYDHVGTDSEGQIFNGADDNGSGTTGLLQIAEALAARGPLPRSILLTWVSGEEKGLFGSEAWARDPHLPEGHKVVANINIDMIGRTEPDLLTITPTIAHPEFNHLSETVYSLSALEGFPELVSQDADWNRSDHANFAEHLKVPVVFLSAGEHPDYHQPSDTPDKIDYEKLCRIARLVVRTLEVVGSEVRVADPDPTEAELKRANLLGRAIEAEHAQGKEDTLAALWDNRAFEGLFLEPLEDAPEAQRSFAKAFGESMGPLDVFAMMHESYPKRFLGVETQDGMLTLKFGEMPRDFTLPDYEWLYLDTNERGRLRIVDSKTWRNGERESEAVLRNTRLAFREGPEELNEDLLFAIYEAGSDSLDRPNEILELIASWPKDVQADLQVQRIRLDAASALMEDQEVAGQLTGWLKTLQAVPGSDGAYVCAALDTLPWNGPNKTIESALAAYLRQTGDPAGHKLIEAETRWMWDDMEAAIRLTREAIELEPDLQASWRQLLSFTEETEDYSAWPAALDEMVKRFGLTVEEMQEDDLYQYFMETEAYETWAAGQ